MNREAQAARRVPHGKKYPPPAAALLLSLGLVALGGCSNAEPAASGSAVPSPSRPPARLRLPTYAEAKLPEADTTEPLARRFLVPDAVARRYALGAARDKGGLGREARVCAQWLRVGEDNTLLATEFLVGTGPECEGWAEVLAWARGAWTADGRLVDAQRASVGHFYTVAVSPYSFQHPMHEAHAGLSPWVFRASHLEPEAVPWRCVPEHVRAKAEANGPELASYACSEGSVVLEHLTARVVTDVELRAHPDALGSYRRWQHALARQYSDAIPSRIERLERLWTRYEEGASR